MADREFEEFRQFFEQLPQHIKAPSNCYTACDDGEEALKEEEEKKALFREEVLDRGVEESPRAEVQEAPCVQAKVAGGEYGASSSDTCRWLDHSLPSLLARYAPDDVFFALEFSLHYLLLPGRRSAKREFCDLSFRSDRHRLTVLMAANMSGSEKLPLLAVGREPLSPYLVTPPTAYLSSAEGDPRLTRGVFEGWLRRVDESYFETRRRVAMVVEESPCHRPLEGLRATRLVVLPTGSGWEALPLREKVVRQLRASYRWWLLDEMRDCIREGKSFAPSLPDALYHLRVSWASVEPEAIADSFRSCGFLSPGCHGERSEPRELCPPQEVLTSHGLSREDFEACLRAEEDLEVAAGGLDEVEHPPPAAPPPRDEAQVNRAFEVIQSFLQTCQDADLPLGRLAEIQAFCKRQKRTEAQTSRVLVKPKA